MRAISLLLVVFVAPTAAGQMVSSADQRAMAQEGITQDSLAKHGLKAVTTRRED